MNAEIVLRWMVGRSELISSTMPDVLNEMKSVYVTAHPSYVLLQHLRKLEMNCLVPFPLLHLMRNGVCVPPRANIPYLPHIDFALPRYSGPPKPSSSERLRRGYSALQVTRSEAAPYLRPQNVHDGERGVLLQKFVTTS